MFVPPPVCGDEHPPVSGDENPPVFGDEHPSVGDIHLFEPNTDMCVKTKTKILCCSFVYIDICTLFLLK